MGSKPRSRICRADPHEVVFALHHKHGPKTSRGPGQSCPRASTTSPAPNFRILPGLVGAIHLEQNDEWAVQRARCMTLETIAPLSADPLVKLPAVAAA